MRQELIMPAELGYLHPDRIGDRNWQHQRELLRRTSYRGSVEKYEEVADVWETDALVASENGDTTTFERLADASDRLRVIQGALKDYFEAKLAEDDVCLFVDYYESDVLANAENHWYNVLHPEPVNLQKYF
jgi:hypothetical protein